MFCELTVFLCSTESNIVCGEGKGHTETIRPSVLSVLVVFKDVAGETRPTWMDISSLRAACHLTTLTGMT